MTMSINQRLDALEEEWQAAEIAHLRAIRDEVGDWLNANASDVELAAFRRAYARVYLRLQTAAEWRQLEALDWTPEKYERLMVEGRAFTENDWPIVDGLFARLPKELVLKIVANGDDELTSHLAAVHQVNVNA